MPDPVPADLAQALARIEALEARVANQEHKDGFTLLVFSGELDRLLAAFTVAVGAAACGMRVSMFFNFWGVAGLKKSGPQARPKSLVERMFGWLLPGGLSRRPLSRLDMAGIGRAIVAREMRPKQISDLPTLIQMAADSGVEILLCDMSMGLMGIREEEIIDYPGRRQCGVAHFVDLSASSHTTLFI